MCWTLSALYSLLSTLYSLLSTLCSILSALYSLLSTLRCWLWDIHRANKSNARPPRLRRSCSTGTGLEPDNNTLYHSYNPATTYRLHWLACHKSGSFECSQYIIPWTSPFWVNEQRWIWWVGVASANNCLPGAVSSLLRVALHLQYLDSTHYTAANPTVSEPLCSHKAREVSRQEVQRFCIAGVSNRTAAQRVYTHRSNTHDYTRWRWQRWAVWWCSNKPDRCGSAPPPKSSRSTT